MRALLAALALLAGLLSASAYPLVPSNPGAADTPTSTYVGPGDIKTLTYFWGLQGATQASALAGQRAVNIRRASDNTTADITILSTGNLDVATAATFCTATTCFVKTLYEQISHAGTCDLAQASNAQQPQLIFSFSGSLPAMKFTATNTTFLGVVCGSSNQPISAFTVAQITDTTATNRSVWSSCCTSSGVFFGGNNGAATTFASSGVLLNQAASLAASHFFAQVFNTTSSINSVDNANATGNAGTNIIAAGNEQQIGNNITGTALLNGYVMNLGLALNVAWNSTDIGLLHTNQAAYWGTP